MHVTIRTDTMKQSKPTLLFIAAVLTSIMACSGPKSILAPDLKQKTHRVAVLGFESTGFLGSEKLGTYCANEASKRLFLQKKALVIDRSVVLAAAVSQGITSLSSLSHVQLRELSKALDIDTIILGEIRNINRDLLQFDQPKFHLLLTIRLIDPQSGGIIGMVSHEQKGAGKPEEMISQMVRQAVSSLGDLKLRDKRSSGSDKAAGTRDQADTA